MDSPAGFGICVYGMGLGGGRCQDVDASGNAITVDQGSVKIPAGFQLQLFGRGRGKSFKIPASLERLEILLFLSVGFL